MNIHPLDLPNLNKEPESQQLWVILNELKFDGRNFEAAPSLPAHLVNWLSKLISNGLYWLDPDDAERLCETAAHRLSQSCGFSSRSNTVRTLDIGPLEFRLHEPGLTNDNIGHKTWGSCLILANRLVTTPDLLKGTVIELGSGTGLCGMICAHLGHESYLTDLPQIKENIDRNIHENRSLFTSQCTSGVLDWSSPKHPGKHYDTVVISDPVYSASAPTQISQTLKILEVPRLLLQLPLRLKFEDLREELYNGIIECGYTRQVYIQEAGEDDFGPSEYVFTLWTKSA